MAYRIGRYKFTKRNTAPPAPAAMYRFSAGQDDLEVIPSNETSQLVAVKSEEKPREVANIPLETEKVEKNEGGDLNNEAKDAQSISDLEPLPNQPIESPKIELTEDDDSLNAESQTTIKILTKDELEEDEEKLQPLLPKTSPESSPSHFSITKSFSRKQSAENVAPSVLSRLKGRISRTVAEKLKKPVDNEDSSSEYSKLRMSGSEPNISELETVEQAIECKDDDDLEPLIHNRKSSLGAKNSPKLKPPVMSITLSSLKDIDYDEFHVVKGETLPETKTEALPPSPKLISSIPENVVKEEVDKSFKFNVLASSKHFSVALIGILMFYYFLPLDPFSHGLLIGCASTMLFMFFFWWLFKPSHERVIYYSPDIKSLPQLNIPSPNEKSDGNYEGWMNELVTKYDAETFHVNDTQSVFISLSSKSLIISKPKNNIPRRAMWNEPTHKPYFIQKRFYDITGATVFLLPTGIPSKRRWLKRYPICLSIPPNSKSTDFSLEPSNGVELFLFARTDREKEEWFRRFECAINNTSMIQPLPNVDETILKTFPHIVNEETGLPIDTHTEFSIFMTNLIASTEDQTETPVAWINVIIGRMLFNIVTHKQWQFYLKKKIQKKLGRLKFPDVLEELKVVEVELGVQLPQILRMSDPTVDERGVWVDFDLLYTGVCSTTLETKVNLIKAWKKEPTELGINTSDSLTIDEDDSENSSTDENSGHESEKAAPLNHNHKFMWFVDKITRSQYFQNAVENKYIKKAVEEVSNTPLNLAVELKYLRGTLTLNIPPHPTDRVWYGFRGLPKLELVARPTLGTYKVKHEYITDWIQKKLLQEFQKVMVLPNMDDLVLPFLQHSPNYWP